MASFDFSNQTPTRGRVTVMTRKLTKTFMFNPSEITDSKSAGYGWQEPVGSSGPVPQFGSGGKRTLKLSLYLDADRGRVAREGSTIVSCAPDIEFFQSLLYPSAYELNGFAQVSPSKVILNMGALYVGTVCVVENVSVKVTFWTPEMDPVRATVDLDLSVVENKSRTAAEVFGG